MSGDKLTVDRIDKIVVSRDMHHNNLNVLRSLEIGLFQLATFTRQREIDAAARHGKDNLVGVVQLTEETLFLGCVFDWFAMSLVSYMSAIKLIQLLEDNNWELSHLQEKPNQEKLRKARSSYIESIAPAILQWRNKIAAHRAATDPRVSDNLSMLTYSTSPGITYRSPYYRAGDMRVEVGTTVAPIPEASEVTPATLAGHRVKLTVGRFKLYRKKSEELSIESWSLTGTYETLVPRYWPDRELPELCS